MKGVIVAILAAGILAGVLPMAWNEYKAHSATKEAEAAFKKQMSDCHKQGPRYRNVRTEDGRWICIYERL